SASTRWLPRTSIEETVAACATDTADSCNTNALGIVKAADNATAEAALKNPDAAFIKIMNPFSRSPHGEKTGRRCAFPLTVITGFSPQARLLVNLCLLNQAAWLSRHAYPPSW